MEYAARSDLSALVGETSQQWVKQDFSQTPFSHSKCHHRGIMMWKPYKHCTRMLEHSPRSQPPCGGQLPLCYRVTQMWAARWVSRWPLEAGLLRAYSFLPKSLLCLLIFNFTGYDLQQSTWCHHITSSSGTGLAGHLVPWGGQWSLVCLFCAESLHCYQRLTGGPLNAINLPPQLPSCLFSPWDADLTHLKKGWK